MDQADIVNRIVSEVKSQGAFDEFRKDSIADMDTKPAYQNLKQRVETTVQQFLAKQEWAPDMNKNHLRERLRRHIMDSGFLDKGVERIVDQVVNPRIPTVIKPKIQEIAYKMMGMPLPQRSHQPPPPPPMMHQLPPLPLTAPTLTLDTTMMNLLPTDLEQVSPDSDKATELSESKEEPMDMDVDDDESPPFEPLEKCASPLPPKYSPMRPCLTAQNINDITETQDTALSAVTNEEVSRSMDAVASDSQVSTVSRDFAEITTAAKNEMSEHAAVNISEEAQMPKFSDNPAGVNAHQESSELHFDIKKDEIKFEGTERKNNPLDEAVESKNEVLSPGKKPNKPEENSSFQFTNINADSERFPVPESSLGSLDDTSSTQMKTAYKTKVEKKDSLEKTTSNSSQSSRHKKHSKHKHRSQDRDEHRSTDRERSRDGDKQREKHRERERDRERDRERHKDKDRSGRSKHTSSGSKQSTSSSKLPSPLQKKDDGSAASGKLAYSSSNSSSRSATQDKKRERSEREHSKRHTSTTSRDHSENSSSKKDKLKTDAGRDDHNEKKDKHYRRKSRDSKDKDKSPSQGSTRSTQKSSSTSSKSKSRHESSSSRSSKTLPSNDAPKDNVKTQRVETHLQNVVVLNDILQHPSTDCIQLAANTSGKCIEIVKHPRPSEKHCERISSDNDEVLSGFYEDEDCNPLRERLHVIDSVLGTGGVRVALLAEERTSSPSVEPSEKRSIRNSTDSGNDEETKNKKGATRRRQKSSPTPSEISVNSKENVVLPKNADDVSRSSAHQKQDSALSKLTQQQRYSSEDLYKPRPVLSQKSKRRGLNSAF